MSILSDVTEAKQHFGTYIERLQNLLKKYDVQGENWYSNLRRVNRNPEFKTELTAIWQEILEQQGGKLGLSVILGIIAATLGGIGIAGFGGAIGLPLAALLVPVGILLGNELDTEGGTRRFVRWVRGLFGSAGVAGSSGDVPDASNEVEQKEHVADSPNGNGHVGNSAEEGFAVLLELLRDTNNRSLVLEEENRKSVFTISKLASDVAVVSNRFDSSFSQFGATLSELGVRCNSLGERCNAVGEENASLKADSARLFGEISSVRAQAEVVQSELGKLRQHAAYLSGGFLIVALSLILELIWRFAH